MQYLSSTCVILAINSDGVIHRASSKHDSKGVESETGCGPQSLSSKAFLVAYVAEFRDVTQRRTSGKRVHTDELIHRTTDGRTKLVSNIVSAMFQYYQQNISAVGCTAIAVIP